MNEQNREIKNGEGNSGIRQSLGLLLGACFVLSFALSLSAHAEASSKSTPEARECFRDHIRHALALNHERLPLYHHLTDGDSIAVSNRLIFLERVVLTSTYLFRNFDSEARPYQEAGVPIVCDDYIDMKFTPAFREKFAQGAPDPSNFKSMDGWTLSRRLKRALREQGFSGLHAALTLEIKELEKEPRFNCLLRHTLESLARIAWLAPRHEAQALKLGLPSPASLSTGMIEGHFTLFGDIIDLDAQAAKIQALGVPIICQDVPPIPWHP